MSKKSPESLLRYTLYSGNLPAGRKMSVRLFPPTPRTTSRPLRDPPPVAAGMSSPAAVVLAIQQLQPPLPAPLIGARARRATSKREEASSLERTAQNTISRNATAPRSSLSSSCPSPAVVNLYIVSDRRRVPATAYRRLTGYTIRLAIGDRTFLGLRIGFRVR